MRKIARTILFLCLATAFVMPKSAGFCVQEKNAQADGAKHSFTAQTDNEKTELVSPSSYRQYLSLNDPSDVAVSEDYTAIADGNIIYVYDEAEETYLQYEHDKNAESSYNKVTKLQFDATGNLYFLDASTHLYVLDPTTVDEDGEAADTQFTCSTFAIHDETLYFTNVTTQTPLSKVALSSPDISKATTLVDKLSSKPTITFWEDELYYTDGGKYLNKINPYDEKPTPVFLAAFPAEIVSMTMYGGSFFASDIDGNFFAYNLSELTETASADKLIPTHFSSGGYSSLSKFGNEIYAVKNHTIKQYSIDAVAFTDFEIGNASDAINRLDGATDVCLSGHKLFIADENNARISVYDTTTQTFDAPISTTMSPAFMTSDGATLLLGNEAAVTLYDLSAENYGNELLTEKHFSGDVAGAACVYGTYYILTERGYFYQLTNAEGTSEWTIAQTQKSLTKTPRLLTSDAYGNLYVAFDNNSVFCYSEEEFMMPAATGKEILETLPAQTKKLAVDYRGNLYAFAENVLHKFTKDENGDHVENTSYSLDGEYVYQTPAIAKSFAFGIEENATYVLYEGNYLIKSAALDLPTVKNIPVNSADEYIFSAESAEFSVVKTKPNALIVEFDVNALQGATEFPYLAFERSETPKTALQIGQTDEYNILAVFDETKKQYSTYLVETEYCESYPDEEYRTQYAEENRVAAYLINDIPLYKFPYLTSLLTVCNMPRGTEVTLLGEIDKLDHAYYQVAYTDENGEIKTGYIPKVYVTLFNGEPQPETIVLGETESDHDALWRCAYILLGLGAICILVDYLLLRKPKNEDDNNAPTA